MSWPCPVLAVGYATANTFAIVLELLYALLLTIEECPPSRFCFPAMEANQIGHELPSLRVGCLWVSNERGFECFLRALPFFPFNLPIVLIRMLSDRSTQTQPLASAANGLLP